MTEHAQEIIRDIKSALTKDSEKDMQHLYICSEKYRNDEDYADILPEIISLMESVIESVQGIYINDDSTIYLSLNHVMELYEYAYFFKTDKDIRCTDIRYNEYYRAYAYLLLNFGEYEAAAQACRTAIEWNPVDLESLLGLAEIYLAMEAFDEYLEMTKTAYRYCCTRATMARYYRNMGRYYLEKYKPEVARALYVYSNIYFQSEAADSALKFIESALNEETLQYEIKQLQQILLENEVEPGPDADTIGIIYRVGKLMLESNDLEKAKDCFAIVYDITQDEETGEILAQIMNS